MSHNMEEEEEEEEEEVPINLRKGNGFKMFTNVVTASDQNDNTTLKTSDDQHINIVQETVTTRIESHEVDAPQIVSNPDSAEIAKKEAEARAQAEEDRRQAEARQAKLIAEQKQAMEKAQQEALRRAQQAQEQAVKEAQERAQREAQMRVQQAQAEAKAKQAQAQAQAHAQAQAQAQKKAQEEAARRAEREAQIKAERERAEQLRVQQQAKMAAAKQTQQPQAQVQKLQQNQPPNVQWQQQQQQKRQQPVKQEPQKQEKQPQIQVAKQQVPTKQVQQTPQKKGPAVPAKPGQLQQIRGGAPETIAAARDSPAGRRLFGRQGRESVTQGQAEPTQALPARQQTTAMQLIPNTEEIQVIRGGDVQQAYLSNLAKPAELLPQQEVKPIHTQEDQSWVTQNRIPVEIQAPQPAKITIPDLQGTVEVKPTVIVPRPAQTTRVEWNEFPQEEVKEMRDAPRIKAGEWHPDNQAEIVGAQTVRSAYQPGRIGQIWPPPQNENIAPRQEVTVTKAAKDTAWRRDEKAEVETRTAWSKNVPHNLKEQRVWPPPENEVRIDRSTGVRLKTVQWPPAEFEQQIQQDVDILQTRLPVKPNQRQWPPPPPEYRTVLDQDEAVTEQKTTKQIPLQKQMEKRTTITKGMVRVGGR